MSLFLKALKFFTVIALFDFSVSIDVDSTEVLGDKEYYVGNVLKVNWYRAAQICAAKDMTLDAIESESEYNNLRVYLFNNGHWGQPFWLSGSDLPLASDHVWMSTGAKVNYNKWATSQPSSNRNNRCVRTNASFLWVKASCSELHYFICSRPVEPSCGPYGRCLYTSNQQIE